MAIERRDEHTEVVSSNAADVGLGNMSTSDPVRTTAHQTETFTGDPYAVRREETLRVQRGIYLLFGVLEGLLAIRFVLPLLGANPAAGFAQLIYSITKPFLAPFVGLFGTGALWGQRVRGESTGGDSRLRPDRLGAGQSGGAGDGRHAARRAHDIEPN